MIYRDLQETVCKHVGWGRDLTKLSDDELADVKDAVKRGYKQFLEPSCKKYPGHRWSFLSPQLDLSLSKGEAEYLLEFGQGSIIGNLFFKEAGFPPIVCDVGESRIHNYRGISDVSGPPRMATVKTVKTIDSKLEKHLLVYPKPDRDYDVFFKYYFFAPVLSEATDEVFGSEYYGEEIIESCLAVADRDINDRNDIHQEQYEKMLEDAIYRDLQSMPQHLGFAGDTGVYGRDRVERREVNNNCEYESIYIAGQRVL